MAEVVDSTKTVDFNAIKIMIASPEEIKKWSHGEVTKPETINYRTQRPEKDGLFDERIFGPTKDFECYCGKYKKIRYKGVVCDKCGVEVTRSSVRRERMGHIELAVPVTHIWYVRGVPCRIGLILDLSVKEIERVVYFASFIVIEVNEEVRKDALQKIEKEYRDIRNKVKGGKEVKEGIFPVSVLQADYQKKSKAETINMKLEQLDSLYRSYKQELENISKLQVISESKYMDLSFRYGQIIKVGIGAEAIHNLLKVVDLDAEIKKIQEDLKKSGNIQPNKKTLKRLKILTEFKENKMRPEWMILTALPVIPPDLRPMVQLDGGRFAASDLNDLYRRVINRNNRLKRLINQGAPEVICRNEKRMLQEAVDALIDNTARRDKAVVTAANRRKLKSLSDMLRGKQGRFRQNLLGKRVDYSGRSVIVIGPELKLHQCGIPKIMALELFKPFVISKLIQEGYAHNVKNATRLIERQESMVWDILERITKNHLVLLNRAPTLHRLGIQSFQPVLIEGKAIQIHPLVCAAYNADFDGDQMAVYIPLSEQAKRESQELMKSTNNLLKPAAGEPVVGPTSDMVLGCYYMTIIDDKAQGSGKIFSSKNEAIAAYQTGAVGLRAPVNVRIKDKIVATSVGRILFNNILPKGILYQNKPLDKKNLRVLVSECFRKFGNEKTVEVVDQIKQTGFQYATKSGVTFAASDIEIPSQKNDLLTTARKSLNEIEQQYRKGLITDYERYLKVISIWHKVKSEIEQSMLSNFNKHNPIFIMVTSGSRGTVAQLTQIAGMKGLVANPQGEIIELPIEANYKEGFNEFEYFISTHGARKGRSDTALRTADAGYLTRRLIDVAQDIIITNEDCGVEEGITIYRAESEEMGEDIQSRIIGRILASDVRDPKMNKILYKKGDLITHKIAEVIYNKNIESINVFSVLKCQNLWGVCQKCYGRDLATGKQVQLGAAVGIVAAQAIGEPGTQLTMRTFHVGGIAGEDITLGLPRVEELFEARMPKTPATIATISGKVKIYSLKDRKIIKIISNQKRVEEYSIEKDFKPQVKNGDKVKARQALLIAPNQKAHRAMFDGKVQISKNNIILTSLYNITAEYIVAPNIPLKIKNNQLVEVGAKLTEGHLNLAQMVALIGVERVQRYVIREVQDIYASQGQIINDKHIELIVRQMFSRVRILDPSDSKYLPGQVVDRLSLERVNNNLQDRGRKIATFEKLLLGITRVALSTDSFLSAASFQETTGVLIEAAISGKIDYLRGLKENVIIGKLIPAGTGFSEKVAKVKSTQIQS